MPSDRPAPVPRTGLLLFESRRPDFGSKDGAAAIMSFLRPTKHKSWTDLRYCKGSPPERIAEWHELFSPGNRLGP